MRLSKHLKIAVYVFRQDMFYTLLCQTELLPQNAGEVFSGLNDGMIAETPGIEPESNKLFQSFSIGKVAVRATRPMRIPL